MAGRKEAPFSKRGAQDAIAALGWLHATGELRADQVTCAIRQRDEPVAEIQARLEELGGPGGRGPSRALRRCDGTSAQAALSRGESAESPSG